MPFSSEKVCKWLKISNVWEKQYVLTGYQLPEIEILFERIDKKIIEEEKAKLVKQEEVWDESFRYKNTRNGSFSVKTI